MKIIIIILFAIIFVVLMIIGQHRMIYHPRPYNDNLSLPDHLEILEYETGQGEQTAFYLPPLGRNKVVPDHIWVMFGGNASLALDWLEFITGVPDPGAAFLLIDYPGYGRNQGRADPKTIKESAEKGLSTLAAYLETDRQVLEERLMVMGHSLGSAVALLFAENHQVSRLVLISPFTSLKDMAGQVVGPLLARTLFHDYDNRARLKEILKKQQAPPITIVHGARDKVVPVGMGRELAEISDKINYIEIKNGDHNYIMVTARDQILCAMLGANENDNNGGDADD